MAKQLLPGNDDIPQDFKDTVDSQRDLLVDHYTNYAQKVFAQIPGLVGANLKAFRLDWSQISLDLGDSATGGSDL